MLLINLEEVTMKIKLKCKRVLRIHILKNRKRWITFRKIILSVITSFLVMILILTNISTNLTSTLRKINLIKRVIQAKIVHSTAEAHVGQSRMLRQEFATCKKRALQLAAATAETSQCWIKSPLQYFQISTRSLTLARFLKRWIIKIRIFIST